MLAIFQSVAAVYDRRAPNPAVIDRRYRNC
jgi:hypothetical protein